MIEIFIENATNLINKFNEFLIANDIEDKFNFDLYDHDFFTTTSYYAFNRSKIIDDHDYCIFKENFIKKIYKKNFNVGDEFLKTSFLILNMNMKKIHFKLEEINLREDIFDRITSFNAFYDFIKLNFLNMMIKKILNCNNKVNIEVTKFKNIKTELYDYQKNNLNWMLNIENKKYDFDISKINKNLLCKGGGIFDEVGMGKTLQSITLINHNECKDKLFIKNNKFRSKATLIICPNYLCGQWLREFELHCKKMPKIISLLTKAHLKKYSYFDLMDCDVVIVSSRYFINCDINEHEKIDKSEIFDQIIEKNVNIFDIYWHRLIIDEFHEIESSSLFIKLRGLESDYRWMLSGTPFKEENIRSINLIKNSSLSNFFDYLTFCPKSLLKINYVENYEYILHHFSRNLHSQNLKTLKLPIVKEENIYLYLTQTERMIYNAHLVNSNNSVNDIFLRQVCCHPLIAENIRSKINVNSVSCLEDIQVEIKKMYFGEFDKAENNYEKCLKRIENIQEKLKELKEEKKTELKTYSDFVEELKENQNNVIELKKIRDGKEKSVIYYKNFIDLISNKDKIEETVCTICLGDIERNDIGITFCAHIFCYTCISMIVKDSKPQCPTCEKKLTIDKIFSIDDVKEEPENIQDKDDLRNTIGTKLSYIIKYIKSTPDKYRIIFSQWDYLLKEVGKILTKNNISNVYCSGNVYQRDKVLKLFNGDNSENNVKVIMLSSETSTSGSNLSNAEEVILLDPVYGEKQVRINTERQAIGRVVRLGNKHKEIKVLRLITKNTVEEDIHKLNQ